MEHMKTTIPPPILGMIIGVGMWFFDDLLPNYSIQFSGQSYLAILLGLIGLSIDIISVLAFFKAKTTINPLSPEKTNTLVINGLYRISRNPMYLGMLLMLIAWCLWLGNPVNLLLVGLFVIVINTLQIIPEESVLQKHFGQQYIDYKNRVRRWL